MSIPGMALLRRIPDEQGVRRADQLHRGVVELNQSTGLQIFVAGPIHNAQPVLHGLSHVKTGGSIVRNDAMSHRLVSVEELAFVGAAGQLRAGRGAHDDSRYVDRHTAGKQVGKSVIGKQQQIRLRVEIEQGPDLFPQHMLTAA